jgi:hypothetical protein
LLKPGLLLCRSRLGIPSICGLNENWPSPMSRSESILAAECPAGDLLGSASKFALKVVQANRVAIQILVPVEAQQRGCGIDILR